MRLRWILPLAAGAALAPVWVMAPPPTRADGPDTVEGLIERCRATGLAGAPATFKSTAAKTKEFEGKTFTLQVAPEDCTGCGACVHA